MWAFTVHTTSALARSRGGIALLYAAQGHASPRLYALDLRGADLKLQRRSLVQDPTSFLYTLGALKQSLRKFANTVEHYRTCILACATSVSLRALIHPVSCQDHIPPTPSPSLEPRPSRPASWLLWLRYLLADWWLLIAAIAFSFASAVLGVRIPLLLGELVNTLSQFVSSTQPENAWDVLRLPCLELLKAYILHAASTSLYIGTLALYGEKLAFRLRRDVFGVLLKQDIAFFDCSRVGELIGRLSDDVQEVKTSVKKVISQGLRNFTQSIGCAISLYRLSPKLSGILLASVVAMILIGSMLARGLRILSQSASNQSGKATAVASEALSNIKTVRAFSMEDQELDWYSEELQKACLLNCKLGFGIAGFQGLSRLGINGLTLAVLFGGGHLLGLKEISPGDLMGFLVSTEVLQRSLGSLSALSAQFVKGATAVQSLSDYLHLTPSPRIRGGDILQGDQLSGHIQLHGVTFSYPSRPGQSVLRQVTLDIPSGKTVALCGPSGGGKSTIVSLVERFYDASSGKVTLDGKDMQELDAGWIRGQVIGYIGQEPVLFSSSVKENIRYGCHGATDDQVVAAAKMANAHDFISHFPEGYDTKVGERGATLSGGQKQRIAIARALIKNPKILILDEATSALDSASEALVQEAISRVSQGRTVIVIAHRLSTIEKADVIAVIADGRVVETGTHDELLKKGGMYIRLVNKHYNNPS